MIPGGSFTTTPVISSFPAPYNDAYTPLTQNVLGGISIGDPSHGRTYQTWTVNYNGTSINISPSTGGIAYTLVESNVFSVSLAFDNNMSPVIAWMTTGGANLYYYNTVTESYNTTFFPGVLSCRVCVDDPAEFYNASSDVIFGYTLGGNLYYRQQRDRYATQYLIGASTKTLIRMSLSTGNRLQFELR